MTAPEIAAASAAAGYVLDRAVKTALVTQFFAHRTPSAPTSGWPSVVLIQPITRGATNLAAHLDARGVLDYPGKLRHVLVCDVGDTASGAICRAALPEAELVLAEPDQGTVASKVAKMAAGVANRGDAEIICFVDDDILLPPLSLRCLVAPLYAPLPAGVTFGLACQTSWDTVWESLMSGFVNANALLGYVPLTYFTDPYTVTGHLFALRSSVFDQAGGMTGLGGRFDDDHEIARRVRSLGLSCVQTPLIYQVENALPSFSAYQKQLRRWFVMPRQAMVPHLTPRERWISAALSLGNLLPSVLLVLCLFAPGRETISSALAASAACLITYLHLEEEYLPVRTPVHLLWILPIVAFVTPLQVLIALMLPGDRIEWRGQTYRAMRGGLLRRWEEK